MAFDLWMKMSYWQGLLLQFVITRDSPSNENQLQGRTLPQQRVTSCFLVHRTWVVNFGTWFFCANLAWPSFSECSITLKLSPKSMPACHMKAVKIDVWVLQSCAPLSFLLYLHGPTAALPCTILAIFDSCPYLWLMDFRLHCLVLIFSSDFSWLNFISFLGYLCFTYCLRAGPKPSFPFVYKLINYHVVLYFNLTWFYLKPSCFS
jgi:hypothetical protein